MADVKWIKLDIDMFDNYKIKHLRKMPEGNSIALIWVMLLTLAGRCNANGKIFITKDIPYTTKTLSDELGFKEKTVKLALDALESFDMISTDDDSFIFVTGWSEHQNIDGMEKIREQNRLRKQAQRARQDTSLSRDMSRDITKNVTQCHATEEEREREIEEEKEYSIYLSNNNAENFDDDMSRDAQKRKLLEGPLGKGVVFISDEQFDDLLDKLSLEEFDHYMEVVADCELNGRHFAKSHYQAILDMADMDRRRRK